MSKDEVKKGKIQASIMLNTQMPNAVIFKSMFQSVFVFKFLPHSMLLVPEEKYNMVEQILIYTGFSLIISLI